MQIQSAAVGTVEQKGEVTAMQMSGREAQTAPVDICISGLRDTSLCPEQAVFSEVYSDAQGLKGCKAGTTLAPSDTAEQQI